ncbi:aminotransferase class IV family protein [Bowmanella denitrificans]|uniref:Aminotransferase class IV family protein n=1 Tax=Bowmanella denitrificans TaxID=366582 RepID=A0ABP3GW85_9ALTE
MFAQAEFVTTLNGQPATAEPLTGLAFAGFAHFTAMQVRDGRIRGLDLHLKRLQQASLALFANTMSEKRICRYLADAVSTSPTDCSLLATLYSSAGEFTANIQGEQLHLFVRTLPPSDGPSGPFALKSFIHQRHLAHIKHSGEVAKTYYLRQAAEQGFNDAVFVDQLGFISEGSIWNIAFWDGESVIWPKADYLLGTTMGIVQRQLSELHVPQQTRKVNLTDLASMQGAVLMNSWTPALPVYQIDEHAVPDSTEFSALLRRAFEREPRVIIPSSPA